MPVPMQVQRMEKRADCSTFLNMVGKVCGVRVVLVVDPLSEKVVALRLTLFAVRGLGCELLARGVLSEIVVVRLTLFQGFRSMSNARSKTQL